MRKIKNKADRRDEILDAMLDLVVKRGFHDAPMSVLARKSGASPGVIYHYFSSKDELILALYRRVTAIKHEAFFRGYKRQMRPREALMLLWLNAYDFYRTHKKEARFLDQYLNSPYAKAGESEESRDKDPVVKRIVSWMQPRKFGGVLKDLPPEAINSLTLGLAASMASAPKDFTRKTLVTVAETVWAAIAEA
jgi:TetR/AcrR family transcriptional regulator, repressor of fatR-cypB operon